MHNQEQFDVVVIGAGPSGACAAAILVESGLSVAIVEKAHFPRFSIGESLLPQSMVFSWVPCLCAVGNCYYDVLVVNLMF